MNHRLLALIKAANGKWRHAGFELNNTIEFSVKDFEQLINSIKKEIANDVAAEFIGDTEINAEKQEEVRTYLRGLNAGLTDALYRIKLFGEENEY